MLTEHPNAIIGGLAAAAGGGTLAAWLLNDVLDWGVPDKGCTMIAGGIAFVVLWVGRRGIRQALRDLWFGPKTKPARKR